jgi:3-oxoacyl-[acyl-carrier protein] reductase
MHNVIVTGGSRGLGLAMATGLAAAGYRVIAVARSESAELAAAAAAHSSGQGGIAFRALDLTDGDAVGPFVRSVRAEFGPLYGLINNAGLGTSGVLSMMQDDAIERLVRLNTIAPILMSKYVVRSMMSERAGRIVNVSSVIATSGFSGLSAYAATKSSLIGFTRSLAREVGQLGITVNAVAPGFIDTEMTHELSSDQRDKIVRRSALRRLAQPQDVAAVVEFLLSEKARNITGVTMTVDAGGTA